MTDTDLFQSGDIKYSGVQKVRKKFEHGNGYVDAYYGYNAVANKGNTMDDQDHGTHAAGIIAAANNSIGVVGVACNARIRRT